MHDLNLFCFFGATKPTSMLETRAEALPTFKTTAEATTTTPASVEAIKEAAAVSVSLAHLAMLNIFRDGFNFFCVQECYTRKCTMSALCAARSCHGVRLRVGCKKYTAQVQLVEACIHWVSIQCKNFECDPINHRAFCGLYTKKWLLYPNKCKRRTVRHRLLPMK